MESPWWVNHQNEAYKWHQKAQQRLVIYWNSNKLIELTDPAADTRLSMPSKLFVRATNLYTPQYNKSLPCIQMNDTDLAQALIYTYGTQNMNWHRSISNIHNPVEIFQRLQLSGLSLPQS